MDLIVAGVHDSSTDQHADSAAQRVPLGAQRTHRGLGVHQADTETAGRKHITITHY